MNALFKISKKDLYNVFLLKYGSHEKTGWGPRQRLQYGYYQPADYYESLITKLVAHNTFWLDVGGGGNLFPHNIKSSDFLSKKAAFIVGVDPSDNIKSNPFIDDYSQCFIEEYQSKKKFDLVTLRMVAEHIEYPEKVIAALYKLLKKDGVVVIFTVNRWSPATIISRLLPFKLHYPIKKFFFRGEEKDTFPTVYKMNTRKQLKNLFEKSGFKKELFSYIDDCCTFNRFKLLNNIELIFWKIIKFLGVPYPENCILAVYRKIS